MSDNNFLLNISSKYIIEFIVSKLERNVYYNLIKYNKKLHQKMKINIIESLFNYLYNTQTKNDKMSKMNDDQNQLKNNSSYRLYSSYLTSLKKNINLNGMDKSDIFLIKYNGYKINDFPLPNYFNKLNYKKKSILLEKNSNFIKYTLNDRYIELIYLINELREKNNLNNLICNKIENLYDFFLAKNSNNSKYLFKDTFGEFKNKLLKKDEKIIKIILIEELKYIIILENEKNEYIFIYSDNNNQKSFLKIDKEPIKSDKFVLVNNTIPIIYTKSSNGQLNKSLIRRLSLCFKFEGFQIFSFKNDTVIGVLEGPPKTPFEKGYFLFKIIFPGNSIFEPPKFIFISNIFHPNISEDGFVSIDILNSNWSPWLANFHNLIYSVQSLLDDPNTDDFINEKAAKLYKENRNIYDEIVRKYTSNFASYSKFLDDLKKMSLEIIINKNGENFECRYFDEW